MVRKILFLISLTALFVFSGCEQNTPETNSASSGGNKESAPSNTEAADETMQEQASLPVETASQAEPAGGPAEDESAAGEAEDTADTVEYAGMRWYTDLKTAEKKAQAENKHIFINFSGSDWCYWCKRLDEEVLSHKAFSEEASKDFVFLLADFPSDESLLSAEQRKKNEALLRYYGVQGFPTIILARSNGKAYAMAQYQEGGPKAYLQMILQLRKEHGS